MGADMEDYGALDLFWGRLFMDFWAIYGSLLLSALLL